VRIMKPLSAAQLLIVWERALGLSSPERAQLILQAAREVPQDPDLQQMPVGERDARLLTLREWMFGNEVNALTRCPKCQEEKELALFVSDLRVPDSKPAAICHFSSEDYSLTFRLPTGADLAALSKSSWCADSLRKELLGRCVSEAKCRGETVETETLPDFVVEALSEQMSEMDPQADIELSLQCEACKEKWKEVFDVESFFWTEIQAWAVHLLNEVHHLAASYGWSEAEILAMSETRRNAYLNMITG
jgi:hypothetical protein